MWNDKLEYLYFSFQSPDFLSEGFDRYDISVILPQAMFECVYWRKGRADEGKKTCQIEETERDSINGPAASPITWD